MKLLLKILFFLIAIFQTNIIESKNILISEVIALELKTSDIYIQQNEKIEVLNVILKNDFGITCKSDLVVYRNWGTSVEAIAAKGVGKFKFPGTNPAKSPKGFEWKSKPGSTPGSKDGNWYNPKTGESLRPDLNHPGPIGPHWDYKDTTGKWWRIFHDGSNVPK